MISRRISNNGNRQDRHGHHGGIVERRSSEPSGFGEQNWAFRHGDRKATEIAGGERLIKGYRAMLDLGLFGLRLTILVRIALDSQSEEALKAFEAGVLDCPSITRCFLMSGSDDYIAIVLARDIEDFERIHRTELSRLPRVARIQSSFAIRDVVDRAVPPAIFGRERQRKVSHR
jgi:DNA-binding Lrp family transcriptional regulator